MPCAVTLALLAVLLLLLVAVLAGAPARHRVEVARFAVAGAAAGCNGVDSAGNTGDDWCTGANPSNWSQCDPASGQCVCRGPFIPGAPAAGDSLPENGARPCTACQPGDSLRDGVCELNVQTTGCAAMSSAYCAGGGIPGNSAVCSTAEGECICGPGYINAGNDLFQPCTACAPGYVKVEDGVCVPSTSLCLRPECRSNGGRCASNGACLCPYGSRAIPEAIPSCGLAGLHPDAHCNCGSNVRPGCYSDAPAAGPTPAGYARLESGDCFDTRHAAAWQVRDSAGRSFYDRACECEFGPGARFDSACPNAGTDRCGGPGQPEEGTIMCNVPWVVEPSTGRPAPPHESCSVGAKKASGHSIDAVPTAKGRWAVWSADDPAGVPFSRCTQPLNQAPRAWHCPAAP